ncbi:MAG: hypothetical protein ACOYLQ_04520 [Hyphomicrobiaceae bacterium]|jgi:hypothetical protein
MSDATRLAGLETEVAYLGREVEGEKLVTRHILEQTRRNNEDLATLIKTADRLETRVDRLEMKLDGFIESFPVIVADVVREVLRAERR